MALVIGHSQVKYMSEYLWPETYSVFAYPGAKTQEFMVKDYIYEVAQYFSTIALVVGANDVGRKTPDVIAEEIQCVCEQIHYSSPSATVLVSEILPRGQNWFPGCQLSQRFLEMWNREAGELNTLLRQMAFGTPWLEVIKQSDFHTMFGANRQLIGRDGLHLNRDGNETLASNIENSVNDLNYLRSSVPSVRSSVKRSPAVSQSSVASVRSSAVSQSSVSSVRSSANRSPELSWTLVRSVRSSAKRSQAVSRSSVASVRSTAKRSPEVSWTQVPSVRSSAKRPPAVSQSSVPSSAKHSPSVSRSSVSSVRSSAKPSPDVSRSSVPSFRSSAKRSVAITLVETSDKFYLSTDRIPTNQDYQRGGGPSANVFCNRNTALSTNEVVLMFEECNEGIHNDKLCVSIPTNPVGGEMYVFDTSALANSKDLRVDKYVWFNDGRKKYPRNKSALIYKTIFKIRLKDNAHSTKFLKHIYEHVDNSRYVIVHYLGDESVYTPISHGNSKDPSKVFRRTCPSVFEDIRLKSKDITKTCTDVEKESKSKAEHGTDLGIKTAKNVEQVKNHFYKARRDSKLSHDSVYNLCAMSYELENFNKQIDIYPSLVCISGYDEILKEFNHLLIYDQKNPIKMFYDTTYELSGLFVSVLSYQHIIFEGNKIIPVAFMLHD